MLQPRAERVDHPHMALIETQPERARRRPREEVGSTYSEDAGRSSRANVRSYDSPPPQSGSAGTAPSSATASDRSSSPRRPRVADRRLRRDGGLIRGGQVVLLVLRWSSSSRPASTRRGCRSRRSTTSRSRRTDARRGRVGVAAGVVVLSADRSGAPLLASAGAMAVTLALLRSLAYTVVRRTRRRGTVAHPTLILGAGQVGGQLAGCCCSTPSTGCARSASSTPTRCSAPEERPVAVLGGHDVARPARSWSSACTTSSSPSARPPRVADGRRHPHLRPARRARSSSSRGCSSCTTRERATSTRSGASRWCACAGPPSAACTWQAQAASSTSSSPALPCCASRPVMVVFALLVRWEGGPGVLFRQERVGLDGRAVPRAEVPLDAPGERRRVADQLVHRPATTASARSAGACARARLDELPQLLERRCAAT